MIQTDMTTLQKRARINEINERLGDIHAALMSSKLALDEFTGDYRSNREFIKRFKRRMALHIERNAITREREDLYEDL